MGESDHVTIRFKKVNFKKEYGLRFWLQKCENTYVHS